MRGLSLDHLNGKSILLLTELVYGNGDFYAAKKLILQLHEHAPRTKVYWLIVAERDRADAQEKVNTVIGENIGYLRIKLQYNDKLINTRFCNYADLVLLFPTVHYLNNVDFEILRSYKKPILQVYEYDGVPSLHQLDFKSELGIASSGFNGLGLFLDNLQRTHFNPPRYYDANALTFFSYVNLDNQSCVNESSVDNYLRIALQLAGPNQSVDLIANTPFSRFADDTFSFAWSLGFTEIRRLSYHPTGGLEQNSLFNPTPFGQAKLLRLINPFPLSNKELREVLAVAHPFMQLTGDQTLSEALSLGSLQKGVFPFYQMMFWKNDLFTHWQSYAENLLGAKHPYLVLLNKLQKNKELNIPEVVTYWQEQEKAIVEGSLQFYALIKKEKDLATNFLAFLDHVFYMLVTYPQLDLKTYSQLIVQLVAKLGNSREEREFLNKLGAVPDPTVCHNLAQTMVHLLCLNTRNFSLNELHQIASILLTQDQGRQLDITNKLHQLRSSLPGVLTTQALPQMPKNLPNAILLAVNMMNDGMGDLVKCIGVYHQLRVKAPTTTISCLVHCHAAMRPLVMGMLRQNKIGMANTYVIPLSEQEYRLFVLRSVIPDSLLVKYQHFGFDMHQAYALYLSVATPCPSINSIFRLGRWHLPYLEIGEIDYVSYKKSELTISDKNHHLRCMGLDENSVGIEITETEDKRAEDILQRLSPDLRQALLDGASCESFLSDSLFMPAYVKNDRGVFSIHYLLILAQLVYPEKTKAVLWLHSLIVDLKAKPFQNQLRDAGFSEVVVMENNQKKTQFIVEGASNHRSLRILIGPIVSEDFDLLYQLAGKMGSVVGCTGQNSFEKALSFGVIPAFSAPAWQTPLISQARSLLPSLFSKTQKQYQVIDSYLSMLGFICYSLNEIYRLQNVTELADDFPFLQSLSHQEFIIKSTELLNARVPNYACLIPETDPLDLLERFFKQYRLEELQTAWSRLCDHIKKHKNLNTWVSSRLDDLLPGLAELAPVEETVWNYKLKEAMQSGCEMLVSREKLPATAAFFQDMFNQIRPQAKPVPFRIRLTNLKTLLIEPLSALDEPTLLISTAAWSLLTQEEFRFGLRYCLAVHDLYVFENHRVTEEFMHAEEILAQITGDRQAGLGFLAKTLTALRQQKERYEKDSDKTRAFRLLSGQIAFYEKLMTELEIGLAIAKQPLNPSGFFLSPKSTIPESLLAELRLLQHNWEPLSSSSIGQKRASTVSNMSNMLEQLPQLRIRQLFEYEVPGKEADLFLQEFNRLEIDPQNPDHVSVVSSIVASAHEHRLPVFNALYLSACNKIHQGKLLPIGPFVPLDRLLNQFIQADAAESAHRLAAEVEGMLLQPGIKGLFSNSLEDFYHAINRQPKQDTRSELRYASVGRRIRWQALLDAEPAFSRLRVFAIQTQSREIASLLFRLGDMHTKGLWSLLSADFLKESLQNRVIVFGTNRPGNLNLAAYATTEWLLHRYYKPLEPSVMSLSAASIEAFIQSNKDLLAIGHLQAHACRQLVYLFNQFLVCDKKKAEQFIRAFYCDPDLGYGMYALRSHYQSISLGVEEGFPRIPANLDGPAPLCAEQAHPLLGFILENCPNYLPVSELLDSCTSNFSFNMESWPLAFFMKRFKLQVDCLSKVQTLVDKLKHFKPFLRTRESNQLLDKAICNSYVYAVLHIRQLAIFSPYFYQFMLSMAETPVFRSCCALLWQRMDFRSQILDKNAPIQIGFNPAAVIYRLFDTNFLWPNSRVRDCFSEILLEWMSTGVDANGLCEGIETLLFGGKPLSDRLVIKELINHWVYVARDKYGLDDGSDAYFQELSPLVRYAEKNCPVLYVKEVLESLAVGVGAQKDSLVLMSQSLQAIEATAEGLRTNDSARFARTLAKSHCVSAALLFLSLPLNDFSQSTFIRAMKLPVLPALNNQNQPVDLCGKEPLKELVTYFYHHFWALPSEEQTRFIRKLLMPACNPGRQTSEDHQAGFNDLVRRLLPLDNEHSRVCTALLQSYWSISSEGDKPQLLQAILWAITKTEGSFRTVEAVLPKLLEALGSAGVKVAQAAHGFSATPVELRKGLGLCGSNAQPPYRWELWAMMRAVVPAPLLESIDKIGPVLSVSPFYVAMEVWMKDGQTRCLRLLREHAAQEVATGFQRMKAAVLGSSDNSVLRMASSLMAIIEEAEKNAAIELNQALQVLQYQAANLMYNLPNTPLVHKGCSYDISVRPIRLEAFGTGYQFFEKANAISFNTLTSHSNFQGLYEAVAMVIFKSELALMLSGRVCDFDRSGNNVGLNFEWISPNHCSVLVHQHELGSLNPESPTPNQLRHCQHFINSFSNALCGSNNLFQVPPVRPEPSLFFEQLTSNLQAYLREQENKGVSASDLARLRGMFKGLIALHDYWVVIPKTPDFILEIKTIFNTYAESRSLLASIWGMFSDLGDQAAAQPGQTGMGLDYL